VLELRRKTKFQKGAEPYAKKRKKPREKPKREEVSISIRAAPLTTPHEEKKDRPRVEGQGEPKMKGIKSTGEG